VAAFFRLPLVVFAMCLVPRAAAVFIWPPQPTYYSELANSLARGQGFTSGGEPITAIEPLYPAFLAVLERVTGGNAVATGLLQAAVGAIGGVLLWQLAEQLGGRRAAIGTTVLYALYPYYVRQAGAWIEVCFATTLLIAAVRQYTRIENIRGAALCGAWLGLLVLTRATFLVLLVGLTATLALSRRPGRALALFLVAIGVTLPWTLRDRGVDGSLLPPRVGENLFVSTSEFSRMAGPRYDVDLLVQHGYDLAGDEIIRRLTTAESSTRTADRVLLERALTYAKAHPLEVAWLKARNALYLFYPGLLPAYEKSASARAIVNGSAVRFENLAARPWIYDAAHTAVQSVILVLGLAGLWLRRARWRDDLALLIAAGSFALVYTVFFPTTRLLAPAMFVPMFYAGSAIANWRVQSED
jgi:hypothetical protein